MAQDMNQFKKNIERWSRAFPAITEKVYKRFGPIMISDSRIGSLSGQVLNEQTGELKRSMKTILKKDKDIHMLFGTDVLSPKGFGYGAYWFRKGRDFINPPIDKNIGKLTGAIADDIERKFSQVVR